MTERHRVKTLRQSTAEVESKRAFEFWCDTALAMSGVSIAGVEERRSFAASRLVAVTAHGTLLHTEGPRVDVERSARHVRQDGRDTITIALVLRGNQYVAQGTRGGRMSPGDISITDSGRPFLIGAYEDYEEIRLSATRADFKAHIGEPDAYAGRLIGRSPLNALFATYLRSYAALVPGMTEAEAGIANEGTLHLLRGLVGAPTGDVRATALRSLAAVHIERSLHHPKFGPDALCRTLCVSRSRLYAAFADGEGVAAAIRDARLDRAHRQLSVPSGDSIATIMYRCGFTNASVFSTAFRRRFGSTPRDLKAANP
ncbi:helix-turn-helix domain-containing protein [Methylobacterium sp. E-005]|uniref:helix-turn-helix domain-containing protein n=1 Tax=Methylobacterium sp. E-005 TaxID=2836549 RepID=UPI001FBBE95D|nr:helix-turn-helix domain-containing protein [Methylobacterium sp. E-005]MCJ2089989.1 helix-turn-helix domain-containing protein [Methylobacterium sp. E-005]